MHFTSIFIGAKRVFFRGNTRYMCSSEWNEFLKNNSISEWISKITFEWRRDPLQDLGCAWLVNDVVSFRNGVVRPNAIWRVYDRDYSNRMHRLRNLRLFRSDPDDRHDNQWKHETALAAFSLRVYLIIIYAHCNYNAANTHWSCSILLLHNPGVNR